MPRPFNALTAVVAAVNDSDSVQTLLAANPNRLRACVYNNSTAILYIKYGATATASDFTVALVGNGTIGGFHQVMEGYTGVLTGIWASNQSGAALVTELSD